MDNIEKNRESNKTASEDKQVWTMNVEEIFIKNGLTPKEGNKTGSCIMPAPKQIEHGNQ